MPLRAALELALRRPSIIAWLVAAVMSVGLSFLGAEVFPGLDQASSVWLGLLTFLFPTVVSAVLIFCLARSLLTGAAAFGRPLYARFIGIFVLAVFLVEGLRGVGDAALYSFFPSSVENAYAPLLIDALTSMAVFPLFVRCFATAAGIEEPRLGRVWSFVYDAGWRVMFWYVVGTAALNLLAVFLLFEILPFGEGSEFVLSLVDGLISATAQILRSMLDIVAVTMLARGWRDDVEAFA